MKKLLLLLAILLVSCSQPSLTFNEMVTVAQDEALSIQPQSNFYEASATKKENGIKSVFQGVDNTTIIVGVTSKGKVVSEVIDTPFLEDLVIQLPVKITLEQGRTIIIRCWIRNGNRRSC